MRFCVPIPCFFKNSTFEEAIRTISSLGFDAAETYAWPKESPEEIRRILDAYGVELLSMCTTDFRLTEPECRQIWLDGLLESCIAAQKLGVHRLITQVGKDTGAPREEQHASFVAGL